MGPGLCQLAMEQGTQPLWACCVSPEVTDQHGSRRPGEFAGANQLGLQKAEPGSHLGQRSARGRGPQCSARLDHPLACPCLGVALQRRTLLVGGTGKGTVAWPRRGQHVLFGAGQGEVGLQRASKCSIKPVLGDWAQQGPSSSGRRENKVPSVAPPALGGETV